MTLLGLAALDPVIVSATRQRFGGVGWTRKRTGYYQHNGESNLPWMLHRAVWQAHFGPIPDHKGLNVHHIDGDPASNAIGNLMLLHKLEHVAGHLHGHPDFGAVSYADKAAITEAWRHREEHVVTCVVCGGAYGCYLPALTRGCSYRCSKIVTDRARRLRGLPAGDPRHGTVNGYTNCGCRCDLCSAAAAEYQAAYKARAATSSLSSARIAAVSRAVSRV